MDSKWLWCVSVGSTLIIYQCGRNYTKHLIPHLTKKNPQHMEKIWVLMYNPPRESSSETLHTSTPTDLRLIRAAVFIIKEIRCIQQTFGLYGRRLGWDDLRKQHRNMYIIKGETDHQPRLNAWDKCSGLVHWEDPEGWGGEGSGRGDRDGKHM